MLRLLDQFVTGLLLGVSAFLLVLWFRSHAIADRYRWIELADVEGGGALLRSRSVWTGEGGLGYTSDRQFSADPDAAQRIRWRAQRRLRFMPVGYSSGDDTSYPLRGTASESLLSPIGVHFQRGVRTDGLTERSGISFAVPLWLPILLAGGYPLTRFIRGVVRRERQERIFLGLCPRCGVDVRGCPSRCPCCGKREPLPLPAQRVAA